MNKKIFRQIHYKLIARCTSACNSNIYSRIHMFIISLEINRRYIRKKNLRINFLVSLPIKKIPLPQGDK